MEETVRNEKIENYLMGRLDEDEMRSFRLQMDQDPELRAAVKDHQYLLGQIDTLYDYQASKLIKKVQHDARLKKSSSPLMHKSMVWIFVAAAVLALSILAINWFSNSTNEDLYAAYYEPYVINFVQRGNSNDINIVDAGTFYRNAEYSKALPILVSAFSKDPKNTHIQVAIGICQHELNNYESAIQAFKPLVGNKDPLYFDQASWYTALAHLRLDQIDLCKKQLQLLTKSTSSSYRQKAQKLLTDLN